MIIVGADICIVELTDVGQYLLLDGHLEDKYISALIIFSLALVLLRLGSVNTECIYIPLERKVITLEYR
jgi:hypothetical protein